VDNEAEYSYEPRLYVRLVDWRGATRSDVSTDLFRLLWIRYSLAAKVYYHPVKAAATRMLLKVLEIARSPQVQALLTDPRVSH